MKTCIVMAIFILALFAGCETESKGDAEQQAIKPIVIGIEENHDVQKGSCVLTATGENDGRYQMVDRLFSVPVECSRNSDCYYFLLLQDDYRSMAPEFEPYLNCEKDAITGVVPIWSLK